MSTWNPAQYSRFSSERRQPFDDLLALVQRKPAMRVADLGCGSGALTLEVHEQLRAEETLGIDDSETMLTSLVAGDGLRFERRSIAAFESEWPLDLLFSNAALHWLPDHRRLFVRLAAMLAPGGQIAVQMPANDEQPTHTTAALVAAEVPFTEALGHYTKPRYVLRPDEYARLLVESGFPRPLVRLQVYTHLLDDTRAVVEWVKGSLLTDYQKRLPAELWPQFLDRYTERLLEAVGDHRPYLLTYDRILLWAMKGEPVTESS